MQFYALEHQLILCHVTCFLLKMFNGHQLLPFFDSHSGNSPLEAAHAGSGSASQDENTEAKTSNSCILGHARIISSICRSTAEFSCFKRLELEAL